MLSVIPMRFWIVGAAGVLLALAIGWGIAAIKDNAVQSERSRIERANTAARDKADEAAQTVTECAGTWNRSTGKCE